MMNGQWFEEIFLYNESSQISLKVLKFLSFKLPSVFFTLALRIKRFVKKTLSFSKTYFFFFGGLS